MTRSRSLALLSTAALLVLGFGLQMALWSRQWIRGDQYALLTPAMQYLTSGELAPFSKGMSGGGRIPGALLQLLIAAPLGVWADFRAPALLMVSSQVVAVLLLLAVIVAARGIRFAPAFAAVYWLTPWRLFHAGILWEPGFVLMPAALHLGACWLLRRQRHRDGSESFASAATAVQQGNEGSGSGRIQLMASAGLACVLVATLQIHASFMLLVVATGLLLWRRLIRVRLSGLALGAAAGGLTLVPTAMAYLGGELPRLTPQIDHRVALPVLVVSNAGKAVLYWFRMGSADIGRRLRQTVWLDDPPPGTEAPFPLSSPLMSVVVVLSIATVLIAIYASWRYFAASARRAAPHDGGADWLRAYALAMLVALAVSGAISPVPVQGWHVLIALHAACIPPAVWLADAWRKGGSTRALGTAFVIVLAITSLLVGLGHPVYLRPAEQEAGQQDIPELLRPLIPPAHPER
jgi:hypothetical protein